MTGWKWSTTNKAEAIQVNLAGTLAVRNVPSRGNRHRNPSVFATEPLTKTRSSFRVHISKLGKFIGIGVADISKFIIEGDKTLGTQSKGFNSSIYYQNNGLHKIQAYGEPIQSVVELRVGDTVDVYIDFQYQQVHYWVNNTYVGTIRCAKYIMTEGLVYPCVNLSSDCEVAILNVQNDDLSTPKSIPIEETLHKNLELQLKALEKDGWHWGISPNKKPSVIEVDIECIRATRTGKAHNPTIMADKPLTRQQNHFRVQVMKVGHFVGIGIAELDKFVLEGGKTLGQQQITGINSSYFWQNNGINKIQMYGEGPKLAQPISLGSIIDIKVDFDAQRIYFWHNERMQGFIACTRNKITEGTVYPAANLSIGSEIVFRNEKKVVLDMNVPYDCPEEDDLDDMPVKPFPTNWHWSQKPHKKAPAITIDTLRIHATRSSVGHNPGVMTTFPFTKQTPYIQFKIMRIGKFVGIGLADGHYMVSGGTTLGSQITGINASYFWQNNGIQRLQMNGEEKIRVSQLGPGDKVGICVNFMEQTIFFYKNCKLEGKIKCLNNKLEDGKVFPCVNLSDGTEVQIDNVSRDPTYQGDE